MDAKQAEVLADQVLRNSRSKSQRRARVVVHLAGGLQRIYTGAVTLVGAGLGFYWAQRLFHGTFTHVVVAVVCGLAAAIAWSPSHVLLNRSSKRTR
jgi:predicted esterase YcpF (UPF0227 family)